MTYGEGGVRVKRTEEGCACRTCTGARIFSTPIPAVRLVNTTHGSLANRTVRPVRLDDRSVSEVATGETPPDFGVILSTRDERDVEPLEVLAELRPDRESSRERLEVETMLRAVIHISLSVACRFTLATLESVLTVWHHFDDLRPSARTERDKRVTEVVS